MQARTVDELVYWVFDPFQHIVIEDEDGASLWEGECRSIPDEYKRRYVLKMRMRWELYIKGVPEVEYVIVTLFKEQP
jgi:hypothetical protein